MLHPPVEALRQLERALQLWAAVPDAEQRAGTDLVSLQLTAAQANLPVDGQPSGQGTST